MEGDAYSALKARNKMLVILLVLVGVLVTVGLVYFSLSGFSKKIENENKTSVKGGASKKSGGGAYNKSNETGKEKNKYGFLVNSVKDIDERLCGASEGDLYWWFGAPLHSMGWEVFEGRRVITGFKFFVWNDTVIYTKGRVNKSNGEMYTYEVIVRDEVNRTAKKWIKCNKSAES